MPFKKLKCAQLLPISYLSNRFILSRQNFDPLPAKLSHRVNFYRDEYMNSAEYEQIRIFRTYTDCLYVSHAEILPEDKVLKLQRIDGDLKLMGLQSLPEGVTELELGDVPVHVKLEIIELLSEMGSLWQEVKQGDSELIWQIVQAVNAGMLDGQ